MVVLNPSESLQLRIALLGNPCLYPVWTEQQLQALKDRGFNAVQLNIAWLARPNDEALNLRDVVSVAGEVEAPRVAERRTELLRRNALAKRLGMRTIFHFGSPYMWRNPNTGEVHHATYDSPDIFTTDDPWFDVLNPLVVEHEVALLRQFRAQFPEVDDILVYTYDQDAWQVSEFRNSKFSRGIPLHERLPQYLRALHHEWTADREQTARMWWEPWELSAGQIYKIVPQLPRAGFGLMLHNNIAEAQLARPVDVWFRNTARMACERGIPVVGEGFFCAHTEEIEPLGIPFPRLVDEQLLAMANVPGVIGVKEYFGVVPLNPDLSLETLALRVADPTATTDTILKRLAARFGNLQAEARRVIDLLADGMQFFPWDASWFARQLGRADLDHGWNGATVRGQMCETPSWESTRHSHFMMTDDRQPHPFMLEDVQLRCEMAADCMAEAQGLCEMLSVRCEAEADREMFRVMAPDIDRFRRSAKSYALHLRETNVAMLLRQDLEAGRTLQPRLMDELRVLLDADVENQQGQGRVLSMRAQFAEAPHRFLQTTLVPTEKTVLEKGYHTLTTR